MNIFSTIMSWLPLTATSGPKQNTELEVAPGPAVTFNDLPDDMIMTIMEQADTQTAARLARTNRLARGIFWENENIGPFRKLLLQLLT